MAAKSEWQSVAASRCDALGVMAMKLVGGPEAFGLSGRRPMDLRPIPGTSAIRKGGPPKRNRLALL
jgi:hypothetical protein